MGVSLYTKFSAKFYLNKIRDGALASVAHLVGVSSHNQKVAGLIVSQGTSLDCWFHLRSGQVREAAPRCFSLSSSLSESNEKVYSGEDK